MVLAKVLCSCASTRRIEDGHELGHSLLYGDLKRNRREHRGGDSPQRRLGHVLVRQASGSTLPQYCHWEMLCVKMGYSYSWKAGFCLKCSQFCVWVSFPRLTRS